MEVGQFAKYYWGIRQLTQINEVDDLDGVEDDHHHQI